MIDASTWGRVLAVRWGFDQLGPLSILDTVLGKAKGIPFADRALVLVANRLIHGRVRVHPRAEKAKIGAAAERIIQRHYGYRYFGWEVRKGKFKFSENQKLLEAENRKNLCECNYR